MDYLRLGGHVDMTFSFIVLRLIDEGRRDSIVADKRRLVVRELQSSHCSLKI